MRVRAEDGMGTPSLWCAWTTGSSGSAMLAGLFVAPAVKKTLIRT
jgi:hypothetical protein